MARLRIATAAALALALACPAAAAAGTVTHEPGVKITYSADPAAVAAENVTVGVESGEAFVLSDRGISVPGGCHSSESTLVYCPVAPLFVVNVLGFDDHLGTQLPGAAALEVHGGGGGDNLDGTPNADRMYGEDGDDSLASGLGADLLDGGAGGDYLDDGPGDDTVIGGFGGDNLTAGPGRDSFAGGDGSDRVDYGGRTAPLTITLDGVADDGEAGEGDNDGADVEEAIGGSANDIIVGNAAGNELRGGSGNDSIVAGAAEDRVEGNEGDDTIDTRDGVYDSVDCGAGNDTVFADLGDFTENCEVAPDPDGDGYVAPDDCAPFDPAVNPGAGEIYGNAVDEDCKDGPGYLRVISPISYALTARANPIRVSFKRLKVTELEPGDRVEVRCKGRGCPFKRKAVTATAGRPSLNVARMLKHRFLRPGAVVDVRILRANQIGKVQRYKVRRNGTVKSTGLCMPVGATAPAPC